MPTLDQLHQALINADAAGDTEAATTLATEIKRMATPEPKQDMYTATAKSDSNTDNLLASIGGAMYAPYLRGKQALGLTSPEDIQQYKDSTAGLWSTPMGKAGTVIGGAAVAAPAAVMAGPSALGAAAVGAGLGALQPTGEGDSTLLNTAIGAAGGAAGKYIGDAVGKGARSLFASKTTDLATRKSANAVRDATVGEAQSAGYVLPPNQVNPDAPGMLNRALEGFSGKLQTAQLAGIKNQKVTDALAKQALGLPPEIPLTPEVLQTVRKVSGTAYETLKKFGPIQADDDFTAAMQGVTGEYEQLARNFPSTKIQSVQDLIHDMRKPQFDSADAVELVKRLRHDGFKNVGSQDPQAATLGRIQIGAQNAIEDLMDRNLGASGNGDFLQVFRKARAMIAKSYTVEKALEESTGKVIASKIGRQYANGKPLTGELETIGKVAQAFPKAVQNVNTSMPGLSPLDYMGGMLTAGAAGPLGLAGTFARPLVRAGLLSKPYQATLGKPQSYEMGLLGKQLPKLDNATLKLLERLGLSSAAVAMPGRNPQ